MVRGVLRITQRSKGLRRFVAAYGSTLSHLCLHRIAIYSSGAASCSQDEPGPEGNFLHPHCCAAVHAGRFSHLRVCIEPGWVVWHCNRAVALECLIKLAECLGCREQPSALPPEEVVCLARGVPAVLASVKSAGGVLALLKADPAAARCLGDSITQATGDLRRRWLPLDDCRLVEYDFALLGLTSLQAAAADLHRGLPGSAQRAYAAARLSHNLRRTFVIDADFCRQLRLSTTPADIFQVGSADAYPAE